MVYYGTFVESMDALPKRPALSYWVAWSRQDWPRLPWRLARTAIMISNYDCPDMAKHPCSTRCPLHRYRIGWQLDIWLAMF